MRRLKVLLTRGVRVERSLSNTISWYSPRTADDGGGGGRRRGGGGGGVWKLGGKPAGASRRVYRPRTPASRRAASRRQGVHCAPSLGLAEPSRLVSRHSEEKESPRLRRKELHVVAIIVVVVVLVVVHRRRRRRCRSGLRSSG